MRWIYLSPHLDDAVLSCGGLIFEQTHQSIPVEIWTFFSGFPPESPLSIFAQVLHAQWGTGDGKETVTLRRGEDQAAAGQVGAKITHFDFLDCIYRRSPSGENLYTETVFSPPHPEDQELPGRIAQIARTQLQPDDVLVCPLALGGHVDHVLARRAAEQLDRPLLYYADIPYLLNYPETLQPAIAALQSDPFAISEQGLETWLAGIAAYKSQVDSLYSGEGTLEQALRAYWKTEHGVRLWRNR